MTLKSLMAVSNFCIEVKQLKLTSEALDDWITGGIDIPSGPKYLALAETLLHGRDVKDIRDATRLMVKAHALLTEAFVALGIELVVKD